MPTMTARPQSDALRGSLDLLVLKTLSLEPMHGWGISQRIQQISGNALAIPQGSLYPSLRRLENQRLVRGEWAPVLRAGKPGSTASPPGGAAGSMGRCARLASSTTGFPSEGARRARRLGWSPWSTP